MLRLVFKSFHGARVTNLNKIRLIENFVKSVINPLTIIAVIRNIKMNFMPNLNSLVDFQIAIIEDSDSIGLIIGKISTPILDFTVR